VIRLQDPELKPYEDHAAWQATWTDDEELLARTPPGYRVSLVNISQVKRLLLRDEMPVDLRLRFLEIINDYTDTQLTTEALQRVEPACETTMNMLNEMGRLSVSDRCRLIMKWNVMAIFCNLNPSLIEAMKLFSGATAALKRSA
jgi:hypothetical protein